MLKKIVLLAAIAGTLAACPSGTVPGPQPQPVTNTAQGGIGTAYRFTPTDIAFAQPVTVTLECEGQNPQIAHLMVQKPDGFWVSSARQTRADRINGLPTTVTVAWDFRQEP